MSEDEITTLVGCEACGRGYPARDMADHRCAACLRGERDAAMKEVERLRAAVKEHRDQRGDDRCWLDDQTLYKAAGLGETERGETALPPKCDFLASCERYWHRRQAPLEHGTDTSPGGMTIRQLTDEVTRLRADRDSALALARRLAGPDPAAGRKGKGES